MSHDWIREYTTTDDRIVRVYPDDDFGDPMKDELLDPETRKEMHDLWVEGNVYRTEVFPRDIKLLDYENGVGMKPVKVTVIAQPTHWGTDLHSGDYRIKLPGNKGEDWEWPWVMFDTKAECVEHWYNDFVKGIEHCKKHIEGEQLRIKEYKAIIKLLKGSGKVKPSDLQQELP